MMDRPGTSKGTAIVTGASSGIGKVYADRLAGQGYDLLLIARREDRLKALATEITSRHGVGADVLVADLSQPEGVVSVIDRIRGDDPVTLLVNNAGFGAFRPFAQTPGVLIARMIALNVTALTALSRAAIERFQRNGGGTIINIGSGTGLAPYSAMSLYGATKAYVHQLTQSLQGEVGRTGVRVQLVIPAAVESEGYDVATGGEGDPLPPEIVMAKEAFVDAALAGLARGEPVTIPSLHDLSAWRDHQAAAGKVLQSMLRGQPADRYRESASA